MHLMIDLETLSLAPNAVVTEIGFAFFDLAPKDGQIFQDYVGIIEARSFLLDVESQIEAGRAISWSTIQWWLTQEIEPRMKMADKKRVPVTHALSEFLSDFNEEDIEGVWGNGSNFDLPILESLIKDFHYETPWNYRAPRDTRTLAMLAPSIKAPKNPVKHSAIHDAIYQAFWMQAVYKEITNANG